MSVSFWTKTWEGDFAKMLAGGFERKWQSIGYDFDSVNIVLNNGVDPLPFPGADFTVVASEREKWTRRWYDEPDFKGGDVYSICELTACYARYDTDYVCYVQGDCLCTTGNWIDEAIAVLEENPDIVAVSPASEVNTWHDENGLDQFFSDQCFLMRYKEVKDPHLMDGGPDIPEYPAHGGDSFEKKIAQWMRKNGKYRKILTNHFYAHPAY